MGVNWNQRVKQAPLALAPVIALALASLLGSCSRADLEQALAPDPQLISDSAEGSSSGSTSAQANNGTGEAARPQTGSPSAPAPGGGSQARQPSGSAGPSADQDSGNLGGNLGGNVARPATERQTSPSAPALDPVAAAAPAPAALRPQVEAVVALGTVGDDGFEAQATVTRATFARWLLATNNRIYGDRPALQIRDASPGSQSVFKDVPTNSPDFAAIQGLAEAGILPSSLSGAQEQVNFRPDAPLTREDLVLWKVPLDVRATLPASNLEAVKQAWGFQDASKISSPALRAVLADYNNGDQAVIRRVFGYTTLLQPQKPVTQAEAAAALGYFGSSGQGVSAGDVSVGDLGEVEGNENVGG